MSSTRSRSKLKHKLPDVPAPPLSTKRQRMASSPQQQKPSCPVNDSGLGLSVSSKKKPAFKRATRANARPSSAKRCLQTGENSDPRDTQDSGIASQNSGCVEKMVVDGMNLPAEASYVKPAKKVTKKVTKTKVFKSMGFEDKEGSMKSSEKSAKVTKKKAVDDKKKSDAPQEPMDAADMDISQILALGEGVVTCPVPVASSRNDDTMSDSEDDDFEEVSDKPKLEPVIPENGVNITLAAPSMSFKRQKREHDLEGEIRRQLKRRQKEIQELVHKVHILCWIAHIKFVNTVLNSEKVLHECHSVLSAKSYYPPKHADIAYLERTVKAFNKNIALDEDSKNKQTGLSEELCVQFQKKSAHSKRVMIFMFIVFLRSLGLKTRLVMSFQTVPLKPSFAISEQIQGKDSKEKKPAKSTKSSTCEDSPVGALKKNLQKNMKSPVNKKKDTKNSEVASPRGKMGSNLKKNLESAKKKLPQRSAKNKVSVKSEPMDTDSDEELSKHFVERKKSVKKLPVKKETEKNSPKAKPSTNKDERDDSDSDFAPKKSSPVLKGSSKKLDRRVLSTDDETEVTSKKKGQDIWVEVFLEAEEKWICVDVVRQKVHCVQFIYSRASHPVVYVIACNNDSTLKDVTKRYVPHWHSDTRKKRVAEEWWTQTMWPYLPPDSPQNREEDEDIARQLHDMPLPKTISEFKDHPLYALKRHLLKFEGIYPPDAPTLGFIRGEPVYGRECVVTLRSREIWFKEARVVRAGETPYKVVKSRPKYDKMTGDFKKDLPLEVFGVWQTEDYVPPTAVNGQVPRNEYGNVDLFKPCMLPFGTVHLQIPALVRVARKLNIDCAPATVGFEFHSGGCHPVHDGFVVCAEFKDQLLEAWEKDVDESAKRAEEKREKRVYGNWRRLIRGLLIRENLKIKYAFGENSDEDEPEQSTSSQAAAPAKKKGRIIKKLR